MNAATATTPAAQAASPAAAPLSRSEPQPQPQPQPNWLLAALLHDEPQHDLQDLLEHTARRLQAAGWRVGGLAPRLGRYPNGKKRMQLLDLRSGQLHDISQNLGAASQACCLDPGALVQAGGVLRQALADGVQLLVINRFGVAEAEGGGFIDEFAAAVQAGVPVITVVGPACRSAWQRFTAGHFHTLPTDANALLAACQQRLRSA